jgi:undecaprenyl diphosphate synthase
MHVAIIMDGNGRWATQRGLPRTAGHVEGAKAVRVAVEAAARAKVEILTLYAFSSANWARPPAEISALMRLFGQYLFTETRRCVEQSIRINVIGRRDRLGENLLRSIEQSERSSAAGSGMLLRIAVDYSSQHSIMQAAQRAGRDADLTPQDFHRLLHEVDHCAYPASEVDLLIRTGSERRLSDFLLWECAFAELHFSDCLWPDFDERRFRCALDDFGGRQRRFGGLSATTH